MKFALPTTCSFLLGLAFFQAQGPINFTATSANVAASGTPVKVSILRWSTDQERKPVVDALDPAAQAAAARGGRGGAGGGGGGGAAGGGGRGRGGRGGGAAALDPDDPANADVDATPARGRGGNGGGRGDAAKPPDPIALLSTALGKAPTVGFLWTNETVGYSIKYAHRMALPDGGERIIILTDRKLGSGTAGWKLTASGTPTDYEFTLIEIRIDSKGVGEAKTSLTSKVILDNEAKTLGIDNYAAAPAILRNVKR